MKKTIISMVLVLTVALVTIACGSSHIKNDENAVKDENGTTGNNVSADTAESESGNLKESGLLTDEPKWVRDGKFDDSSEMCVVVGTRQAKTDKLTIERAIAQSDREFSSFFITFIRSEYTNKNVDTMMTTTHLPSEILSQIDKKRFVKDTWKPKNGSYMFALVCIPKEDFDKIKNELESSEQQRESMCKNARKASDFSVWREYLDNFPRGECASEILSKIMEYKKQNAEKDREEIEKRYTATGKYWSDSAHFRMTWDEAKNYCKNLNEGGFDGWKLPTIDDLRSLVQNCNDTVTSGACQITDGCKIGSCFKDALSKSDCWCPKNQEQYSKLGDKGTFWSDSYVLDILVGEADAVIERLLNVFTLDFDSGGIEQEMFSDLGLIDDRIEHIRYVKYYNNVRCIRRDERISKERKRKLKEAFRELIDQLDEKIRQQQVSEPAKTNYIWPIKNKIYPSREDFVAGDDTAGFISSGFGDNRNHAGIDLAFKDGIPVYSAASGTVVLAKCDSMCGEVCDDKCDKGYGKYIVISHPDGFETRYAKLADFKVAQGDKVNQGDLIGHVGHSGAARSATGGTGSHLHFEIRKDSTPVDPMLYLPKLEEKDATKEKTDEK